MKAPIKPIAALLAATVLPASAGVVADIPIEAEPASMPFFRKKFGLEASYYHQEQPYQVSSMALTAFGNSVPANVGRVENEVSHYQLKFDYDVLPFLNIFALAGWVDGETNLTATTPLLPGATIPFNINYSGLAYGVGTTLSVGGEYWFASVTASYVMTDLDVSNSEIDAFTVQPRVGGRWESWTFWVGAFYLDAEEEHQGTRQVAQLGNAPVSYNVSLQQEEDWSYLVGVNYAFTDSWNATLEGGFGDRETFLASVQWRF